MDYTDRLRSLGLNDARFAEGSMQPVDADPLVLDPKTLELVRLAALVAVGGAVPSYGAQADSAVNAGATAAEIVDVLVGVIPVVGTPLRRRGGAEARAGARVRPRRRLGTAARPSEVGYPPSSPIAVAWCTASLRDDTPSFR